MIGIIEGITDSEKIDFCPRCGAEIYTTYVDGTAECESCQYRFAVIDCEEKV